MTGVGLRCGGVRRFAGAATLAKLNLLIDLAGDRLIPCCGFCPAAPGRDASLCCGFGPAAPGDGESLCCDSCSCRGCRGGRGGRSETRGWWGQVVVPGW
jgi:hypothetical protein